MSPKKKQIFHRIVQYRQLERALQMHPTDQTDSPTKILWHGHFWDRLNAIYVIHIGFVSLISINMSRISTRISQVLPKGSVHYFMRLCGEETLTDRGVLRAVE